MKQVAGFIAGFVLLLFALPFLLLGTWALVFRVPVLAIPAFVTAFVLLPVLNQSGAVKWLKVILAFMLLPGFLVVAPFAIRQLDRHIAELRQKDRGNVASFTLVDKAGIYGLHVLMGVAAFPIYPEASREALLMSLPPGRDRRRVFESDFALGSRRVREKLREFSRSLAQDDTARVRQYGPVHVEWDASEYRLTEPEARYGLALNQTNLSATATREGKRWQIDVTHIVGIGYPKDGYVPLISWPRLWMEEGLFYVLEQCGWLHRYNVEWRFSVDSDDPRL
jgi:hypothetical protein